MKLLKILSVLLVLGLCLAGCSIPSPFPEQTQPRPTEATEPPQVTVDAALEVEALTAIVTPSDIFSLDQYPNLKQVDLSGSTCYEAILQYMSSHPQVEVIYTVSLGGKEVPGSSEVLTLESQDFDFDTLVQNLKYLPRLVSLSLPRTSLTAAQLTQLKEAWPELALTYTVMLLGMEYSHDTTALDLSSLTGEQAAQAAPTLAKLTKLASVELMAEGKSNLTVAQVKPLVAAAPWAVYHYEFTLFGKKVTSADTSLEYKKHTIGNDNVEALRSALDIMPQCSYVKLDDCGIDNEVLSQLREDYRGRGTKIVWRIWVGNLSVLTDTEKFRAVFSVFNDNCHDLRYCENVKYVDVGHNETLSDFSWVAYMPDLEIMIASGSVLSDLTPFANCKKLEWLELAFCTRVEDLTPLAGCESLRFLNISSTKVSDLMPLDGLPLERFVALSTKVPASEREIFQEIHQDCWSRFTGSQPYGIVWRYDDNGYTYSEYYRKIRDIFGYDNIPVSTAK